MKTTQVWRGNEIYTGLEDVVATVLVVSATSTLSQTVSEVKAELIQMMELDQQGRQEISEIRVEFGNDSSEVVSVWNIPSFI